MSALAAIGVPLGLLARLRADRRGAEAVEFALVVPTLLLLVLGAMEFGRLLWAQSALHISVEQTARCGAFGQCTTLTAPTYAAAVVPQLNFSTSVFTASNASCGFKVTGTYSFTFIASQLFKLNPQLTAMSCVP